MDISKSNRPTSITPATKSATSSAVIQANAFLADARELANLLRNLDMAESLEQGLSRKA